MQVLYFHGEIVLSLAMKIDHTVSQAYVVQNKCLLQKNGICDWLLMGMLDFTRIFHFKLNGCPAFKWLP